MNPKPNLDAFAQVLKWDGLHPGPLLIGPPNTGKTIAAFAVCAKLAAFKGISTKSLIPMKSS